MALRRQDRDYIIKNAEVVVGLCFPETDVDYTPSNVFSVSYTDDRFDCLPKLPIE